MAAKSTLNVVQNDLFLDSYDSQNAYFPFENNFLLAFFVYFNGDSTALNDLTYRMIVHTYNSANKSEESHTYIYFKLCTEVGKHLILTISLNKYKHEQNSQVTH